MDIAILGAGAIGSTFAYHLAKAGHTVTVIARGARLEQLRRDGAIVLVSGETAPVHVAAALDTRRAYDLVLVTVLATQVAAVLPTLSTSAAQAVMFMFNTFEPLEPLRSAVGSGRFVFGFPGGVFTLLIEGKLKKQVRAGTAVGAAAWAQVFTAAGIPSGVEPDMQSWLRSHAALVIPLMSIGTVGASRKAGLSWREAVPFAKAMVTGFHVVRDLGNSITPSSLRIVSRLPLAVMTALLWLMSRTAMLRDLGALGAAEPRMLIDMMTAAAPGKTDALLVIRP